MKPFPIRRLIDHSHSGVRRILGKPPLWEPKSLLANAPSKSGATLTHVASYVAKGGNAGDRLLPVVLRDLFSKVASISTWESVHSHRAVTENIVRSINSKDGVVVGGGGLFLRDTNPNTVSGWQWPISIAQIDQIDVPLCLFAVGYNRFRGQEDFADFFARNLTKLTEKSVFIGLRNHGSIRAIQAYLPASLREKIVYQPCMTTLLSRLYDGQFCEQHAPEPEFLSLNCAFDRPHLRFGERYDQILDEISIGCKRLLDRYKLRLKYYAHLPLDKDMCRALHRNAVPFEYVDLGRMTCQQIIDAYRKPVLAIGMRGHAQMIPFGCHTPILSLVSHDKLRWFLEDVQSSDWGVDVNNDHLEQKLYSVAARIIESRAEAVSRIKMKQTHLWNVSVTNVQYLIRTLTSRDFVTGV